jgi:hypothetical protein
MKALISAALAVVVPASMAIATANMRMFKPSPL